MKTYAIAAIPGDGIGTEVISAGIAVLREIAKREATFAVRFDHFDWGGEYYKTHGRMMPADGRERIRNHDAILFGSAGYPEIPDHVTLWGLIFRYLILFHQRLEVYPLMALKATRFIFQKDLTRLS